MTRTQKPITLVLSSLTEANATLETIGQTERSIAQAKAELEAGIAALRAKANLQIAPLEKSLAGSLTALELFADTNRATLLEDKKKFVVLPGGEFGWRMTPPKVTFGKGGAKAALTRFLALRLKKYLRYTPEIDHEALLRDRPALSGVKYTQRDAFFVKPNSAKEPESFPGKVSA